MRKRTFILASAVAAAVICAPRATFADYAKEFDVKFAGYKGSTTLTNFPALIRLSKARNNFDYSKCELANGGDTRFFDADGNLLPSEVDTWNPGGESLVWVSVPELNRDTTITVRYGNANAPAVTSTDVWTNGYLAVWHMDAAAGQLAQKDATANGKTVTGSSSSAVQSGVAGKVGLAVRCGLASTGGYQCSDSGYFDGLPEITVEAWTFRDAGAAKPSASVTIIERARLSGTWAYGWRMWMERSEKTGFYVVKNGGSQTTWVYSPDTPAQGEWHYHAYRWAGANGYHSETLDANTATTASSNGHKGTMDTISGGTFCIGNRAASLSASQSAPFPGCVDEVRISNVVRSDDWIRATYDTIASDDFATVDVPNDWSQYAHKFSIAFPGVAEGATLENFPVLVKVSEAGIPGFSYADCAKEGGADLRFTDGNGTTPLPCEVEVWNTNGVSLVWVKMPTLTKGTRITAYYGWNLAPAVDPTEVWDANYLAVWHMDAAAGQLAQKDATANGKHIAPNSSNTAGILCGVEGVVGAAAELGRDGVKTGAFCVDDSTGFFDGSANGFTAITVEAWSFQTNYTSYKAILVAKRKTSPAKVSYILEEAENTGKVVGVNYVGSGDGTYFDAWQDSGSGVPCGEWAHSVSRWDGQEGSNTAFLNGSIVKKNTGNNRKGTLSTAGSGSYLFVGNNTADQWGTQVFPGCVDEVRISKVARSDAWVKATYDTIANNATFTRYGTAGDNVKGSVIFFQ